MPSTHLIVERAGWRARLAARLLAPTLDRALIDGGDPESSPRLRARAAVLTSPATRLELADGLDRLIATAHDSRPRAWALPRRESVRAVTPALHDLAVLLRAPVPLYARGVAMLTEILADGTGALYVRGQGAALDAALSDTRAALCA